MQNTYNIYRMKRIYLPKLFIKIESVGLRKQKTIMSASYQMTFYFSEAIEGSPIWWWETYRDFFRDGLSEPKNLFHFALLIADNPNNTDYIYLVSLGKSHFYLSKFIERDFGITMAIRMANEQTVLLKKSRYFNRSKRQEISSYETFIPGSYEAGESVEHLKIKATDSEVWGDKSIIFADSIQMDVEKSPEDLSEVFEEIENTLTSSALIRLPKLEVIVDDTLCIFLDGLLEQAISNGDGRVVVDEFEVYGIDFCFKFLNYNYQLFVRGDDGKKRSPKNIGSILEMSDIFLYVQELKPTPKVESIKIQFRIEDKGKFTKSLKEVIDFYVQTESTTYFLREGSWFAFNQVFLDFLKQSLKDIETIRGDPLIESDYLAWKEQKIHDIKIGIDRSNKLTYREYYFNEKQSIDNGFELMDRELKYIQSIESGKRKYKLEIADLYKEGEIVAVKISENEKDLIYNIEQSKDALQMIFRKVVQTNKIINRVSLWFVFDKPIESITEFNSIQFLLAVSSWQKLVTDYGKSTRIYISQRVTS